MNIIYEFTDKEKEFIKHLKNLHDTPRLLIDDDKFREEYKVELALFRKAGLLYPATHYFANRFIYKVSVKGFEAFKSVTND